MKSVEHAKAVAAFIADESRTDWHDETLWFVRQKRDKAAHGLPEWEQLREWASQIKNHALSNLDNYLVEFEKNALANGINVHWAIDGEEHNQIIHDIIRKNNIQRIVKSKSMLTEECHLNSYLSNYGIEVIDTDLGERIVQLRNEPPSHIVLPAIHLKKQDVSETFHQHLHTEKGNNNPQYLTEAARQHLRNKFFDSQLAITGVNFAVAETGSFVVCTNEGNADMGAHAAAIHIACMGFEKIIPKTEHLPIFLRLLARSATGQPITTYSSHFQRPREGQQMHIVIVDNGRSKQLGRADFRTPQAIARVNRPYENEAAEMVKPHGFVLDFVGIFDKLEKALAFDSDEINAIVKDIGLLKHLFKAKMETKAPAYLALVTQNFNDKDVDNLIEHFRDKERRKEFFKEYKEIEMLYEIISPDAFLRPFIDPYATLSSIYAVVRNAYAKKVYVDRAFQKKTNELVQKHIGAALGEAAPEYIAIDHSTIETIKQRLEGKATKVINLVKAIEKTAEENSDDPFLVALAERAKVVQESFEDRQTSTADALAELLKEIEKNEQRKKEQAAKGLDGLTYFVLCKLTDDGIPNPEPASKKVREAFTKFPNWQRSEAELREVRKQVTFAIFAEEDDMEKVTATVEALFTLLQKSFRP